MNTASNNIIESKSVLMSILAYADNDVLDTHCSNDKLAQMHGWDVNLLRLADGGFAVCDKQTEGQYFTYLFDEEEAARDAFQSLKEQYPDNEEDED